MTSGWSRQAASLIHAGRGGISTTCRQVADHQRFDFGP